MQVKFDKILGQLREQDSNSNLLVPLVHHLAATWDSGTLIANNIFTDTSLQLTNGNVLAFDARESGLVYKSIDNGVTWDSGTLIATGIMVFTSLQLYNGNVLAFDYSGTGNVYKSTDNGTTWDSGTLIASGTTLSNSMQLANGNILAFDVNSTGIVYKSTDNEILNIQNIGINKIINQSFNRD